MKRMRVISAVVMAAGLAWAQQTATNAVDARRQLTAVDAQLATLRMEARQSPQTEVARKASMAAEKAYADALAAIPEIKALDEQIEAARSQMRDLMMKREQALKAYATQVGAVKKTRDDAAANYRQAMMGGAAGEQLLLRRRQLSMSVGAIDAGATAVAAPAPVLGEPTVSNIGK